ncbi:uncharacterized protein LOC105192656 isoform X2 [Harpegnathos saltator]|uniref:uncharacterized protein LOC105192656 isoform X2 n=1 Tax=Harpegnathos saltator TaxID=610380 RepID=UPI000DBED0C9|nr:uncharacterized protein LOC105192656 isoform X2 [Harpegnathos saltator]
MHAIYNCKAMSENIYWTECHKRTISKPDLTEKKENINPSQNAKFVESKSDMEKKGGLSAGNAENRKDDVMCTTSIQQKLTIPRKGQFKIYRDEDERSRPLVRKSACRKEMRRRIKRRDSEESAVCTMVLEREEHTRFLTPTASYRARSLSNNRNRVSLRENKLHGSVDQRCCSEKRKSSCAQRNQHLSNDVKKRTLCSIQTWKDKMRKSHIDVVPKSSSTTYTVAVSADEARAKCNPKNYIDFGPKISRREFNSTRSGEFTNEKSNNLKTDTNDYVNNKKDDILQNITKNTAVSYISNEFVMIPQTAAFSGAQAGTDASPRRLLLTPTKVHHGQNEAANQFLINEEDINQISYEDDYLTYLPSTEREREENAPKLSFGFLRGNINAQQRRIIVGYLIYLGTHCNYESSIIYQAVKLFDTAVDRITVNTEQIQLLAIACLWIILKRDLANYKVPSATKMLKLATNVYDRREGCLLIYEKKILSALKFNVRFADPFSLLMYHISSLNQTLRYLDQDEIMRVYFCGSYLIDVTMLDESLCITSVFVLAITAFELALDFVLASNNTDQTWRQLLGNKEALAIWEEGQISFVKQIMVKLVLQTGNPSKIIYRKYQRSRTCKVSDFIVKSAEKAAEKFKHVI